MRILLAVPTFENITPDTFKSLWDMDKGGHEVLFETVRGYDCATARNNIVQTAFGLNTDYVLMVDSDMVLPKDALVNLTEDPVDVCLGYCPRRSDHSMSAIFRLTQPNGKPYVGFGGAYSVAELRDHEAKRIQIHGGGMACALIRTNLFRRLKDPWFDWVNTYGGATMSEDLYFCEKCKNAGFPIYVDTRVSCGHVLREIQW